MQRFNFDSVVDWVAQQIKTTERDFQSQEIHSAMHALLGASERCDAPLLVPDLFRETALEVLYVPYPHLGGRAPSDPLMPGEPLTTPAPSTRVLEAIGRVIADDIRESGDEVAHFGGDHGEVFFFAPAIRDIVFQALNIMPSQGRPQ